jgi:glyoxylase-like metal-dependent hydrolase (beta-lactamase superfamily II)
MSGKAFASTGDSAKRRSPSTRSARAYAYTAQGDPNSGIIVGDDGCMVIDAQATPAMAGDVIARVRQVTDKPIKYVVLSHYHAVRVLGASAYGAEGIIASDATYRLIVERGEQDKASRSAASRASSAARIRSRRASPGPRSPSRRDVGVLGPTRGEALSSGRGPHRRRHRGLGAGRGDHLFRRPRASTTPPATAATRICATGR